MDARDGEGRTALHLAVHASSAPIIEALCRSKVHPDRHTVLICCMPASGQDGQAREGWAAGMYKAVTFMLQRCTNGIGKTRHRAEGMVEWAPLHAFSAK